MKALATNQTVSWFYQRYKEGTLELSAEFQRNPVWVKRQKDYLIETLLLELPMPEIYVINQVTADGDSNWIVVDGQQRLRTILEFVMSELRVTIKVEGFVHIKSFDDLTSEQKKGFWRYPIVVRDMEDSTDTQIRDLFQRLNKYSVTLNPQELRKARFKGKFLETVTELGDNEYWLTTGLFSPNNIRRMQDLEYIGVLFSTMIGGIYNRQDRLDEFYVNYEDEFEEKEYYVSRFNRNLTIVEQILPNLRNTIWKNKANFYTLFLLTDGMHESLDSSDAIDNLRRKLHGLSKLLTEAIENDEGAREDILEYMDAARYGTNDREKRVRRLRILKNFVSSED